ncbi:DDE-domain-containing protein [Fomitiporia mediterranea MF3/22]|uniref:DDE-domain-containing protein n=1 Tax=Fomitiporia mediterranea (strain MF3/22) TaxID=694068 RepID=UPI0004408A17|nr:DDE-domain-containing protein [Fomitiporia mediterranea MF3/22]EJD05626.1 DDE-domain-containing protein [Fomitiporia mediterranea MF3/22]
MASYSSPCRSYRTTRLHRWGLKSIRRHGEAASVNQDDVAEERARISIILQQYTAENTYNFDETGLFAYAPPDRGLASKQMSGKKTSRFRITMGVCCNANGSRKHKLMFIGKYFKPRCFLNVPAKERGLDYHANSSAWMTSGLFQQ